LRKLRRKCASKDVTGSNCVWFKAEAGLVFVLREIKIMSPVELIILIVVLVFLFGGGGYAWSRRGR
jgi:hypothetical protein